MNFKSLSLDQQVEAVRSALWRASRGPDGYNEEGIYCPLTIYDGYAIVRSGNAFYRVTYVITDDAVEVLPRAEWTKVEQTWQPTGEVKALGDDRVGAYGILFGSPDTPDLSGPRDWFSKSTDFWLQHWDKRPMIFDHAKDAATAGEPVVGFWDKAVPDDVGVWLEGQLDRAHRYRSAVKKLIDSGALVVSSDSAPHLVIRQEAAKGTHEVLRWPIMAASLTTTPCEPRLLPVQAIKSAYEIIGAPVPGETSTAPATGAAGAAGERAQPTTITVISSQEDSAMADHNQEIAEVKGQVGEINTRINTIIEMLQRGEVKDAAGFVSNDGGERNPEVKSFADFLVAVGRGDKKRLEKVYGSTKALSEDRGGSGGYTVPVEMSQQLLEVEGTEPEIVYPRAFVQPMKSRSFSMPKLDQTSTTPSEDGELAYTAGVVAQWTEEHGEINTSDPKFSMLELVPHKLAVATVSSSELNADSAQALEALLKRLFGAAIKNQRDWAFLRGNGVGKPLGALVSPAAKSIARTTANRFKLEDAANMLAAFEGNEDAAVFLMRRTLMPELIQLALAGSTAVSWVPNLRDRIQLAVLGVPVIFTKKVPVLGQARDVSLCDFGFYAVGDRQDVVVSASEHARFMTDETVWKATCRVDGQPWIDAPIPTAESETSSPFVYLAA